MQSDGNSFCGDVDFVFDSFNMSFRDEDNISAKILGIIIYMMSLILYNIKQKCILHLQ